MVSAAQLILCVHFSNMDKGVKNDSLLKYKSVLTALFVPSGLETNILICPWIYLHLHASLSTYKGSFGDSWGNKECTEVGTRMEGRREKG